jgi:3-methyladenine DNA glycosylase AlkD
VDDLIGRLEAELRAAATAERAVAEKAYLKSDLTFLGAPVPATQRAVGRLVKQLGVLDPVTVRDLAEELWREPVHERRLAAAFLLVHAAPVLSAHDAPLLERLIRESRTWALVDVLAGNAAGGIFRHDPHFGAVLDRWAADDDFWIRRSALLALLPSLHHGGTDADVRLIRYADAMVDEREFFIRKAIGWVMREAGKTDPDLVHGWLMRHAPHVSSVTWREAVKYLPDEQRAQATSAYAREPAG